MIDKEGLEKLALLSKLYISEEEKQALLLDLQSIVSFADEINRVEINEISDSDISGTSYVFRRDEVGISLSSEEALRNTPNRKDNHFLVRKKM